MAVVNLLSTLLTNRDATPKVLSTSFLDKGDLLESVAVVAVGTVDSALSTYRLFSIPSGARVSSLAGWSDAVLGAATAPTLDLYDQTSAGSASVKTGFFLAPVFSSATQAGTEYAHTLSGANTNTVANAEKRIWEILGLSSDPGKMYDVVLRSTVNNTTTGANLAFKIRYVV